MFKTAKRIADLSASLSRPKARLVGASLGTYNVGKFRIENGSSARVVMEQDVEAMLITTAEEQHLLTSTVCRSTFAGWSSSSP